MDIYLDVNNPISVTFVKSAKPLLTYTVLTIPILIAVIVIDILSTIFNESSPGTLAVCVNCHLLLTNISCLLESSRDVLEVQTDMCLQVKREIEREKNKDNERDPVVLL